MLQVTDSNFLEEVLSAKGNVVVDFWAEWCGPCRSIAPVLDKLSKEFTQTKFVGLNVDNNTRTPTDFQVKALPAIIIFKEGEVRSRITGFSSEADLTRRLKALNL